MKTLQQEFQRQIQPILNDCPDDKTRQMIRRRYLDAWMAGATTHAALRDEAGRMHGQRREIALQRLNQEVDEQTIALCERALASGPDGRSDALPGSDQN